MNRLALALCASTALATPAVAADEPLLPPKATDGRVRVVEYGETVVTRLTSTNLTPLTIAYGDGERPVLIAGTKVVTMPKPTGDAKKDREATEAIACTDWCADTHGNELTLQPLRSDPGSVLAVTTLREDGTRHRYTYELRTRDGRITDTVVDGVVKEKADPFAYFRVTYRYTAEETAKKQAEWRANNRATLDAIEAKRAADRQAVAAYSGPRNYQWLKNDSPACRLIGPQTVSDDGRSTVLKFAMNTQLPLMNIVNQDGKESVVQPVPGTADDSGVIYRLNMAPAQIMLRRGDQACLLQNARYNPDATAPNTGTNSPDVVREVRR